MNTKIGIIGYGNLGRGVALALKGAADMDLAAVFTRRDPAALAARVKEDTGLDAPVLALAEAENWRERLDALILCGGSATDLPVQTPEFAVKFNVVDSFDTHAKIPEHFQKVDAAAKQGGHLALISAGWDPGMFSLNRLYANAILPEGRDYTFWGRGVSQGHSDAIRRIKGVKNAKQYTVPVDSALEAVRSGQNPELSTRDKHTRECFVVLEEGADAARIEQEIKTMPNYFADYNTTVHFLGEEEFLREHSGMAHGGIVLRSGLTGGGHRHLIEYSLRLDSNPEFTGSVLVACARAVCRMFAAGERGCRTVFDVPPACFSPKSAEELRASLL